VGGIVSFVAFDALFETFHRIFFAGGSYTFDPATERLVQLFPFQFWQETAIVVGAVCIVLAAIVAAVASELASDAAVVDDAGGDQADETATAATSLRSTGSSR
jgi:integral membrane protein (TIGR01906 family)